MSKTPPELSGDQTQKVAGRSRGWIVRHKMLSAIIAVAAVIVVAGGVLAAKLWAEISPLVDLSNQTAGVSDLAGNPGAMASKLDIVRAEAHAARDASDDPVLRAAGRLPLLGDNIRALGAVSETAVELTDTTLGLERTLPQLLTDGRLNLSAGSSLVDFANEAGAAADRGQARLAQVSTGALLPPLADKLTAARTALAATSRSAATMRPYLQAMTILATPQPPRDWLVIMQNLDEARGSGGLVSSWLVLHSENGRLSLVDKGSNTALISSGPVDAGSMPAGYREIWGDSLTDWRSFNVAANFPDNARVMVNAWNRRHARQVDGVLALGQGSVQYLAAAAGPLSINGKTIPADQLTDYLAVGIYRDYPDPSKIDTAITALSSEVFGRIASGHIDLSSLARISAAGSSADYLQLWSSQRDLQRRIVASGLSGSFGESEAPVAAIRLINGGGSKLDAYSTLKADYRLGDCQVDDVGNRTRTSRLSVDYLNAAPASGLPAYMTARPDLVDQGISADKIVPGSNLEFIAIWLPRYATVTEATQDGAIATVQDTMIGDSQLLVFRAELNPGQHTALAVEWEEQAFDDEDRPLSTTPSISLPPLLNPAAVSLHEGSACK